MRRISLMAASGLLMACNNPGADQMVTASGSAQAAAGASAASDAAGAAGASSGSDSSSAGGDGSDDWSGELAPATQIAAGEASLVGVTGDDWVVFRRDGKLLATSLAGDEATQEAASTPGSVLIRGSVVFNWADVDWDKGVGTLSIWSSGGGAHEVGSTLYSASLVAASPAGDAVVYPENATETATDLMVAASDLSAPEVLIAGMGLGSEDTCAAQIGFVGDALLVGWCPAGSRVGTLQRFQHSATGWQSSVVAEQALPDWSADREGKRIFYRSSDYAAYFSEDGEATKIDAGVSRGQLLPDGSAALYTVGDQLRRSALPDVHPTPIVTKGYKQPIAFSSDFELTLYSSEVSYDGGTRRDLLLAGTDALNANPVVLVSDPVAALGRSSMSADGRYVLYLSDMGSRGGTLHVAARDGSEMLQIADVADVLAANGSTLVFSDGESDPAEYPVLANLKVLDLKHETEPRVIEEKTLSVRNFYLDASHQRVVYLRSGEDRDVTAEDAKGIFVREVQ